MDPSDLFLTSMVVSLFNQIIIFTYSHKVSSITIFITMHGNEPPSPFMALALPFWLSAESI